MSYSSTNNNLLNQNYARQVAASKDPSSKINYLKSMLQLPNISAAQQSRIYQLINTAEHQLLTQQQRLQQHTSSNKYSPNTMLSQRGQATRTSPNMVGQTQPNIHQMGVGAVGSGQRQFMDHGVATSQRGQVQIPIRGSFLSPHQPIELPNTINAQNSEVNNIDTYNIDNLTIGGMINPLHSRGDIGNQGQLVSSNNTLDKQFVTQQQLSSAFHQEEQNRSRKFEMEQARRAQAFQDEQRRRRLDYETQLQELENNNINSLRVFNLSPNYTLDELKHAYKRKALEVHPDRPNGNADQFRLITKCYMNLLERLKEKAKNAELSRLQQQSQNPTTQDQRDKLRDMFRERNEAILKKGGAAASAERPAIGYLDPTNEKGFDVKLFNKIYEENKLWDPSDEGYGDFMKTDEGEAPQTKELFGDEFNLDLFNQTFENHQLQQQKNVKLQPHPSEIKDIVHQDSRKDIVAMGIGGAALDMMSNHRKQSRINIYDGDDMVSSTNLLTAYKYNGGIINPSQVKPRQEYSNINELMQERENISFTLSPEDAQKQAAKMEQERQEEEQRRRRIQEQLEMVGQHHNMSHQRMIGHAPSGDLPDYNQQRRN